MSARYTFTLESQERRRPFPRKIIIAQNETETIAHVGLKFIAFLLFARERLQIEPRLHNENIPFVPDLVQFDYELRPALWVECGECSLAKLDKLAVKVPEAEIWAVRRSLEEAEHLRLAMEKHELRRGRYGIVGLDAAFFEEVCSHICERNSVTWMAGDFETPAMQFDFNGLWFDTPFTVLRH